MEESNTTKWKKNLKEKKARIPKIQTWPNKEQRTTGQERLES